MKPTLTLLTFLCCSIITCYGQNFSPETQRQLDSLNTIINNPSSHDTSLAGAYLELSSLLYVSNLDTVIPLCTKTKEIVEKSLQSSLPASTVHSLKTALAGALNNMSFIYKNQGDITTALEYYQQSLGIYKELGDKKGMALSYNNIGYINMNQGDIHTALEYFHQSLNIREELDDKHGMAMCYNNIGIIHQNQEDIPTAIEYFNKSLELLEKIDNKKGMAGSYNNIGYIYQKQNDLSTALEYYHKSLAIREELGDKKGMGLSYNNIGVIHDKQGDMPTALKNYNKSLSIYEEINDKKGISTALANIGILLLKDIQSLGLSESEALTIARKNGERGLQLAQEVGYPDQIARNAGLLTKVARRQGNYQEALEMYELEVAQLDSMKNEETQKTAIRQQTKYEFEKAQLIKEQEEREALRLQEEKTQRRNSLQYSIILVAILAVFGLVLSLGFISISPQFAEGLIFFAFLILFEFLLVLTDPYIDDLTGGAPAYKLVANALLAALIFPGHAFFENKLKKRLLKNKTT